MSLIRKALNLLFPVKCPFCAKPVADGFCCSDCLSRLEFVREDIASGGENACDGITAAVYYNTTVKKGMLRFKFQRRPFGYAYFAREMVKRIDNLWEGLAFDCVLYVPMTKSRESKHGYNQSYILASEVARMKELPLYRRLLVKVKDTPPQSTLHFLQRKENLKGAFLLKNRDKIRGKRVLLIDDVTTTGATFEEIAATLKQGGADSLFACAFAKVRDKKADRMF